jgi:rod shape-determining protein MreB
VVAVPSGITGVEQSAVKEAGHQAGARRVYDLVRDKTSGA